MSDISAIKLPDNSSHNIKAKKLFYAECSTAVNVVAKVISCDGFVLEPGAVIAIRFTDTTTTAPTSGNITLNINGTGAKNIVSKENNVVFRYTWAWYFSGNKTWLFVYNGTYFICLNQDNNNVNPEAFGIGYATCSTAGTTSAKVAVFSGYVLRKNGIIAVKFTYAVPANSTLNINSRGAKNIFYRGAKITAGVINADDIATFVYDGTQYQLISVDADYARKTDLPSIDTALSATSTNPVQNKVINSALAGKAAASHTHTVSQILDFPLYSNIDMFPELLNKSAIVFGDSIAAGYGITNNKHTWSNWIHNLGKMSYIENKAISNTTISRIDSNSITNQVISTDLSPYDYIIVAGGVNDWQGQLSLDGFKQALTTMFDYLARYKAAKPYGNIIIISPINMCLANFKSAFGDCNQVLENMNNGVASISIKKYRSIIEEYALRYEFTLIKGSEFDFPTVAGMKANAYFLDGIHPSERGHYVYAMELLKNLCGYGDYKHFIPLKAHPDFEFPTGEYSNEGYIINAKTYYTSSITPSASYTTVLLDNAININRTKLIRYNATAYFTIKGVVQQICIDSESLLGHLSLYQKSDGLYYAYQSHADVTNIDHLEITVYYTINDDISIHS